MKIAKGKITLTYNGRLKLPFDVDKLAENTELAMIELQKALTIYMQSIIKDIPSGQMLDVNINIKGCAGQYVIVRIDNDNEFILLKDGHAYVLGLNN